MAQIATIIGVISLVGCILLYIIRGSDPDTIEGTRHVARYRYSLAPSSFAKTGWEKEAYMY